MLSLQLLLTVAIIVALFLNFRIGLCSYVAYFILVPYMKIPFGGIVLQWNFVNLLVLFALFFDIIKKKISITKSIKYKPFIPFFLFYACFLLIMPFQNGVDNGYQLQSFRLDVMSLILPVCILSLCSYDKKAVKYVVFTVIISLVVVIGYALFLKVTNMPLNPYVFTMARLNDAELIENQFDIIEGRSMIKISSVFTHPMTFGLFLGLGAIFLYSLRRNVKPIIIYSLLGLSLVSLFVCGIRTPIAAVFVTACVYLLYIRSFKVLGSFCLIVLIAYFVIILTPELNEIIMSIIDKDSANVSGSSLDLRLYQLQGAIESSKDSFLFGKGYNWTQYYISTRGGHPRMLYFESLIIVILCNAGIIGFFIWGLLFYKLISNIQKYSMNKFDSKVILILLSTYYLVYSSITGEYGYMKYFILFYSLILSKDYMSQISNIKRHNR